MYEKINDSRRDNGSDTYQAVQVSQKSSGQDDSYTESLDDTEWGKTEYLETIEVFGAEQIETINTNGKIRLIIQGNDNSVTVGQKTILAQVSIYGRRNIVYLPKNTSAKISNEGIECEIKYV